MPRLIHSIVLATTLAIAAAPVSADKYSEALETFKKAGESGKYFDSAYGYALFPTIGKGGFGIGAAHGDGRVYVKGKHVGDTSMTQVSIGLQLGGQAFSQIIFFENINAYQQFASGNFEFSAEASAVAITAGASAQATTGGGATAGASGGKNDATTSHAGYRKGMAIFTIAKGGLMYEAAIDCQKFSYEPR